MLDPGVCFGVCFGLLTSGLGPGVALEPFVLTGGSEGLFCRGVPFSTAVAPSKAFAAPLIENAGPYPPLASSDEDGGRGGADCAGEVVES